ncbi:MAG TPA: PaaI family thioesterase [Candidatus Binataceae bacterium]|jgi:uncharacterized protein (TIGR00369 family)
MDAKRPSGRAPLDTIEQAPFAQLLGFKIEAADNGEARLRLPFSERLLNPGGLEVPIHGGAIAALIDTAACAAIWTLPETVRSATVSMSLNFTGPGIKSDLIADARVRRTGRRIASLSVEVRDLTGTLVADGLVTYKIA